MTIMRINRNNFKVFNSIIMLFIAICGLLSSNISEAAPPSRQATYTSGEVISSTDVTSNEDAIFNYLTAGVDTYADDTIVNADINSTANIQSDKLNLTSIAQDVGITAAGSFDNNGATSLDGAVTVTGTTTFNGATISDLGTVTTGIITQVNITSGSADSLDINGGAIDNVDIDGVASTGDILYNNGATWKRLGIGTSGYKLESNGAGAAPSWAIDDNLSNVIFNFAGMVNTGSLNATHYYTGSSLTPGVSATETYSFWAKENGASTTVKETVIQTRWEKIQGVSTLEVHALAWVESGANGCNCTVDIGSGTATGTSGNYTSSSPTWQTAFTVDVSGLSNGTDYLVEIKLGNVSTDQIDCYLGSIIAFGK